MFFSFILFFLNDLIVVFRFVFMDGLVLLRKEDYIVYNKKLKYYIDYLVFGINVFIKCENLFF